MAFLQELADLTLAPKSEAEIDESGDEEGGDEGCHTSSGGNDSAEAGLQTCDSNERAKLARVEAALEKLRASEPLYAPAELPELAVNALRGGSTGSFGEIDGQARSRKEHSQNRPRKTPRRK